MKAQIAPDVAYQLKHPTRGYACFECHASVDASGVYVVVADGDVCGTSYARGNNVALCPPCAAPYLASATASVGAAAQAPAPSGRVDMANQLLNAPLVRSLEELQNLVGSGAIRVHPAKPTAKAWRHGHCTTCAIELTPAMDGERATKCAKCARRTQ